MNVISYILLFLIGIYISAWLLAGGIIGYAYAKQTLIDYFKGLIS